MTTEPSTSLRRLILFGVAVTTAAGALGTAFLPYLLVNHPRVLIALSADLRNLVLVGPAVELPIQLAIGVPRRVLGMACTYGLGLVYGQALVTWAEKKLPRVAKVLSWFERVFARFAIASVVIWPAYATSALAGSNRMPLGRYLPAMVIGQVGFVLVSYYLGASVSEWTDRLTDAAAKYMWESTAVFASAVGLQQLVSWVRRRRAARLAVR
jgi:membrane protein DedA with SNARE-associated domain